MVLKCLGSSSSGNCYLLQAADGVLVIECGIPMREVKKALKWRISGVIGCLVSHQHKDHSRYIEDFNKCGIRVMALPEVFNSQNLSSRLFCKEIEPMKGYRVGGFKILTLPVVHDVPCLGFIIEHKEMGKLLFITDTMMLEYKLPPLNHIMLEANYCDKILQENIEAGIVAVGERDRLLHSHMELQTTLGILRANDISMANEVILLHLSARNSDAEYFIKETQKTSGKCVYVAQPGMELNLSINPY